MDIERVIESETYVLGTCIDDNRYLMKVIDSIDTKDFYRTSHQIIFKAMKELYVKNIKFDVAILITKLMKEIKENALSITEITEIATHTAYSTIGSHITLLKNESSVRAINSVCNKIVHSENSLDEKVELLQNALLELNRSKEEDKVYTAAEVMDKTMIQIERAYKSKEGLTGISTGIRSIDNATNGLQRKEFFVIAARPSMGKTAISLKLLQSIKANILFIQLDMSLEGMGQRLLAANTEIENGKVGRGKLSDSQWESVGIEFAKLSSKKNLFFYEPSSTTISKIRNIAKNIQIKNGLDVIIIDHIGKVGATGKDTYEISSNVSKGLKALAKELNICVIALSQLNRKCEERKDKRPMLSDLRDSGKIEEDADIIATLYRDGYYRQRIDNEQITKDILEIDFQKVRNGRAGKIELEYDLNTQRLKEFFK